MVQTEAPSIEIETRRHHVWLFIAGLALCGGGGVLLGFSAIAGRDISSGLAALCCLVFAGLCAWNLVPTRPWLVDSEGFVASSQIGRVRYDWKSIQRLRVGPPVSDLESISFDFRAGREPGGLSAGLTAITRTMVDADRNIPNNTRLSSSEVLRILKERSRPAVEHHQAHALDSDPRHKLGRD